MMLEVFPQLLYSRAWGILSKPLPDAGFADLRALNPQVGYSQK
jgi:hypothetical protein